MRKPGSKERIRQFLLAHIGQVVTSKQIRDAAGTGVSEWARRGRDGDLHGGSPGHGAGRQPAGLCDEAMKVVILGGPAGP